MCVHILLRMSAESDFASESKPECDILNQEIKRLQIELDAMEGVMASREAAATKKTKYEAEAQIVDLRGEIAQLKAKLEAEKSIYFQYLTNMHKKVTLAIRILQRTHAEPSKLIGLYQLFDKVEQDKGDLNRPDNKDNSKERSANGDVEHQSESERREMAILYDGKGQCFGGETFCPRSKDADGADDTFINVDHVSSALHGYLESLRIHTDLEKGEAVSKMRSKLEEWFKDINHDKAIWEIKRQFTLGQLLCDVNSVSQVDSPYWLNVNLPIVALRLYHLQKYSPSAGDSEPESGRHLENPELAEALTRKTSVLRNPEFMPWEPEYADGENLPPSPPFDILPPEATIDIPLTMLKIGTLLAKRGIQTRQQELKIEQHKIESQSAQSENYIDFSDDKCFKPLGLIWQKTGDAPPSTGRNLENPKLEKELERKTEFTKQEWESFGITDLRVDDYVKSGDDYCQLIGNVCEHCGAKESDHVASGLKWLKAGDTRPANGRDLANAKLAETLMSKTGFTQQEWDAFGITGLRMDHFVKVGESYFKPLASCTKLALAEHEAKEMKNTISDWWELKTHRKNVQEDEEEEEEEFDLNRLASSLAGKLASSIKLASSMSSHSPPLESVWHSSLVRDNDEWIATNGKPEDVEGTRRRLLKWKQSLEFEPMKGNYPDVAHGICEKCGKRKKEHWLVDSDDGRPLWCCLRIWKTTFSECNGKKPDQGRELTINDQGLMSSE